MTGSVSTTFALFPLPNYLLVDPLVRIVQHTRLEILVAVSYLMIRRVLDLHSTTMKADGTLRYFQVVSALTPATGMPLNAPIATLKYTFGLGVTVLFLSRLSRPRVLLNQKHGCVFSEMTVVYLNPDYVFAGHTCCCLVE